MNRQFANLDQLKIGIRRAWQRSINMEHIKKAILQFLPRLQQVRRMEGDVIVEQFG